MVRQDSVAARLYIERELGRCICDPFIGLLVERDGKAVGAVILNNYSPNNNIELTAHTSGNWNVRDVRDIARYCFQRVRRITAITSAKNTRAIYMLEALGFKREGMLRSWFEDSNAVIFGLLRADQKICRF